MKKIALPVALCLAFIIQLKAQILDISPVFPQQTDDITITYNAEEGNGALVGVTPVYAHAGLITEASTSPTDWKYVQGNWGTADPNVLMEDIGNNMHRISYNIKDYYGVPDSERALQLAFVFRNANGSVVGRDPLGADIYYPIYHPDEGLQTLLLSPESNNLLVELGDTIRVKAASSLSAELTLEDNKVLIATAKDSRDLYHEIIVSEAGNHEVIFTSETGSEVSEKSFSYFVIPNVTVADPPADTEDGLTVVDENTVIFKLFAPHKENVFLIGDFNNWTLKEEFFLNRSVNDSTWWVQVSGLDPDTYYKYQYLVDGAIRIADPYSELILDPSNDPGIPAQTWPNLPDYPSEETGGIVGLFKLRKEAFDWTDSEFQKPPQSRMVIYEMLMRDFIGARNYQTLLDSLDYLEKLGIQAIELMPVNEFEGNNSWGYNPSYHMALDKYYGTPEAFKTLVNACHERGIAVILDVVYNHAFGQSPLVQLYWDAASNKPSLESPWFNQDARHDFNVGLDFNHDSPYTRYFVKKVLRYWQEEYHIDGFRFDLSKGFTQKNSVGNLGLWADRDPERIAILQEYADHLWDYDEDTYVILEHFADNDEEEELSDYGMMLWGNINHNYSQASMGFGDSNLSNGTYKTRGWNDPHLVTYMESHDEERLMYRNLQSGNSNANYNIKNLKTALNRIELAATFLLTIPGPKLMWQFGELGYDYSINTCVNGSVNNNCRLDPKPIRWDYLAQNERKRLYEVYSALLQLRNEEEAFHTDDFTTYLFTTAYKRIVLRHPDMRVLVLGNFDLVEADYDPGFPETGKWYEYFTGDSLTVDDVSAPLTLKPGEYRIYTTKRLTTPDITSSVFSPSRGESALFRLLENPVSQNIRLVSSEYRSGEVNIQVFNSSGNKILQRSLNESGGDIVEIPADLSAGYYLIYIESEGLSQTLPFVVVSE